MLIVEASGDSNRLADRFDAIAIFAEENPKLEIQVFYKNDIQVPVGRRLCSNVVLNPSGSSYRSAARMLSKLDDAVLVSAGDTRQVIATTTIACKLLHETKTPPVLAALLPKLKGEFIFSDVGGATTEISQEHLIWCALSGQVVAETLFKHKCIQVGLLNIGDEEGKGGEQMENIRLALQDWLMTSFAGNVEINSALKDKVIDVLVAPGFVGNNALKTMEGLVELQKATVQLACRQNPLLYPAALLLRVLGKIFWGRYSWQDYAGAYLMGVNKPVIVTHGRCDERAFYASLKRAANPATTEIWRRISQSATIRHYLEA